MDDIGHITEVDGRFEFRHAKLGLVVRGDHPEWVLLAAAEVISNTAKIEAESEIEGPQDYQVGFAVDKICSLQTSNWRSKNTNPMPGSEALVQVSDGGKKTVLPITNLLGLAEAIAGAP